MFKRAKSDHTSLRTLTTYDALSTYPYCQEQYRQSSNSDMMHAYFPQYTSSEEAAAIWQQHSR